MTLEKTLSLVDLAGSAEKLAGYRQISLDVLPDGINKVKYWAMYQNVLRVFINDPKVTNKKSILMCAFNAPKFGLLPDPVFGQIYFIPYKGILTYQLGYRGMITLADRAGLRVRAGIVYEKELEGGNFDYFENDTGQHFIHRPMLKEKERGKEICVYSCFQDVKTGFNQIQVMESHHIDEIKKIVLARMKSSDTPWKNPLFEPEMRKKTAIRRHAKTEPFSEEIARATEHEEKDERGIESVEIHDELNGIIGDNPDPSSEAGKALNAELDARAEAQQDLPFK